MANNKETKSKIASAAKPYFTLVRVIDRISAMLPLMPNNPNPEINISITRSSTPAMAKSVSNIMMFSPT